MKYGIKLPIDMLVGEMSDLSRTIADSFGGVEGLLSYYADALDALELATVSVKTDADALCAAVKRCAARGLAVTFHGTLDGATDAEAFFRPYLSVFASGLQGSYTVTVHPITDATENERLLREVCAKAEAEGYPVALMLENQRDKNAAYPHMRCRCVAQTVRAIDSPILGMCFDFGHQLSNLRMHGKDFDTVDADMFSIVGHTHIHAVSESDTHFPLGGGETLLEENLTPLVRLGYGGVLLLELLPGRYMEKFDIKDSVTSSVSILKTAVYQVETKETVAAEYRERFSAHTERVRAVLSENNRVLGVLGPSAYIVRLGTVRIAVDPSLWSLPVDAAGREAFLSLLATCDAIVITHAHGDHFDKELLCDVPANIPLYLPDFLTYERANVIHTHAGETYGIGDVTLHVFESEHSEVLPDGAFSHVSEYGFAIEYDGAHFVFPTDVRTYEKTHATFPHTNMLVAHLWLGRANALNVHANKDAARFIAFVNGFGAERVFLSHVFDVRREIPDMWTDVHAALVKDGIKNCTVLRLGDFVKL